MPPPLPLSSFRKKQLQMIVRAPHCKTLTPLSVRPTLQCIGSSLKTFFYPVPNGATMKLSAFPANFPRRRHQSCFHSKTAKAYFSCQGQMEMSNSRSNIVFFFKLFTKIVIWRGITTMSQCCQKSLKMQLIAIQFCDQFWSSCNIWHYLSLLHLATKKPRNLASHQWCRTYAAVSLYLDFCFLCTVWAGK